MKVLDQEFNELIEAKHATEKLIKYHEKRNLSHQRLYKLMAEIMEQLAEFVEKNPVI